MLKIKFFGDNFATVSSNIFSIILVKVRSYRNYFDDYVTEMKRGYMKGHTCRVHKLSFSTYHVVRTIRETPSHFSTSNVTMLIPLAGK